jgi:hypothetical protein
MLFIEMKQSGNFHMIASLIQILKETTDLTFHKYNTLKQYFNCRMGKMYLCSFL